MEEEVLEEDNDEEEEEVEETEEEEVEIEESDGEQLEEEEEAGQRFALDLERNFSVVSSDGSFKSQTGQQESVAGAASVDSPCQGPEHPQDEEEAAGAAAIDSPPQDSEHPQDEEEDIGFTLIRPGPALWSALQSPPPPLPANPPPRPLRRAGAFPRLVDLRTDTF